MELNSNIKGCVLSIENGEIIIKGNDGLQHIYSNVSESKIGIGQLIEVGDTIGETGNELKYRVMGIDFSNELDK